MAHDGNPYYKHLDTIECEEDPECRNVTHEPISVTGPIDDSRIIQPRFGDDVGKPTTASYPYEDQLDLESETCEVDLCVRNGVFQKKGAPLQVGFHATPIEEPPDDCRWVILGTVELVGSESYIGVGIVPPRVTFSIAAVESGTCPSGSSWSGTGCWWSSDTHGTNLSFSRSDAVETLRLNPCSGFSGLGPSIVISVQATLNLASLTGHSGNTPPFDIIAPGDETQTVTTSYNSVTCPTGTVCNFNVPTDILCPAPSVAVNVASVTANIAPLWVVHTNMPPPVTIANWIEARDNFGC